jgi:hypothetical protein
LFDFDIVEGRNHPWQMDKTEYDAEMGKIDQVLSGMMCGILFFVP